MLELRQIAKHYRSAGGMLKAVDGVSLSIAAGDFVAIQGPSGCGKSTLLLTAGGLLAPDAGAVTVEGRDLYALSSGERASVRASRIGFVFQQFHLIPYLDAIENVLAAALAHPAADAETRARTLVERFGLAERRGHKPAELSVGERQRVALARALLNRPALILADEPTGNLDPDNGRVVMEALGEFAESGGAVLLVTHDPGASAYARKWVRMREGRLLDAAQPAAEPVGEEAVRRV